MSNSIPFALACCGVGIIIEGDTPAEVLKHGKHVIIERGIHQMLVELCCSDTSQVVAVVPPRVAALCATEKLDLTSGKTVRVTRDVITRALKGGINVLTWASAPCTVGCPWRHINKNIGQFLNRK